jgi:DNA-binding HxlR family transcriptional regulator
MISKKWALDLIKLLFENEKLRYSEIKNQLGDVSPKTLSARLKELEKQGLIKKTVYPEVPLRVEYSLTEKGISFGEHLNTFSKWTEQWEKRE